MLAVDAGGTVFAISPQRAEIKWVKELKTTPTTHPVTCPKTAFFGNENGLVALDLSTGEFKFYLEGKKVTALAISRFKLYAATENELVIFSPVI
jgi:outer membrane protein assembly factor BamB